MGLDMYSNLALRLKEEGNRGCNKNVLIDFLESSDTALIVKFETREERNQKYECFIKLVNRSNAKDVVDVIRRKDYILLVKTAAERKE